MRGEGNEKEAIKAWHRLMAALGEPEQEPMPPPPPKPNQEPNLAPSLRANEQRVMLGHPGKACEHTNSPLFA